MAGLTRELSITYGSIVVGGSDTTRQIHSYLISEKRFESFTIEFTFVIIQTTEAAFTTEVAAIENGFRKPFQDLTIAQGSSTLYSFLQSANTGLDAAPEIECPGSPFDTGRSRMYRVRITVGLPANTTAELASGLREHSVNVSYSESRRRTIEINGVFTAVGSANARAQYEATISTLETTIFTALSILAANRELVLEDPTEHTYNTKTITFKRIWHELIFSQGGAALNDSAIVNQHLSINRQRIAPGDFGVGVRRLQTLIVSWDASIDKDVTTDLKGKYDSIRGWILTQVSNFALGALALVDEQVTPDYDENRLSVRLTVMATMGGSVLSRSVTVEDPKTFGKVLVPFWDGNPLSKYKYQGPASSRRIVTDTFQLLASQGQAESQLAKMGQEIDGGDSFIHVSSTPSVVPKTIGRDGYQFDILECSVTDVYEMYVGKKGGAETPTIPTISAKGGG